MTPKERAEELVGKFYFLVQTKEEQKQCALIVVDETLNALSYKVSSNFEELKYFEEVKQEIKKL
jgi:hypothetical protein